MAKKRKRKRAPYDAEPLSPPRYDPYKKPRFKTHPIGISEEEFYRMIGDGPVSFTRVRAGFLQQQLNQRSKRRRRQGHAPLQSLEQTGKAALGNDLTARCRSTRIGWPV